MRRHWFIVPPALLGVFGFPAHAEGRDIGRDTLPANDGYATDGYDRKQYLTAYDPRTWGAAKPSVLKGASLQVRDAANVIVRNLAFTTPGHIEVADLVKGWTPTLHTKIDSAAAADRAVARGAGAGRIP
ncbi:putative secreted protein [Streptomyces davaonensis JCM 4913]|uniref:Putative secreted protein n=1 Tax=Streptomyces davaonensis (strain DSM 101723 / JCM 4913 / KCC S-0913 / 768) TaxID=1214101 RepID=K4RDH2_STRDJ|nr:hypothetical protein [Streptomyces davaonensis]CCK30994.1 putative secreted protein [Streptomyces davaonensis JCM 4913]